MKQELYLVEYERPTFINTVICYMLVRAYSKEEAMEKFKAANITSYYAQVIDTIE